MAFERKKKKKIDRGKSELLKSADVCGFQAHTETDRVPDIRAHARSIRANFRVKKKKTHTGEPKIL